MLHIQTRALYPVTGGIMALGANMESLGDTAWVWGGGGRWRCWGAQSGGEGLVLQAVQRGGRVHTARLDTSIAVREVYRFHPGVGGGGAGQTTCASSLVFSFSCHCVF